jgi:hypothetical protein
METTNSSHPENSVTLIGLEDLNLLLSGFTYTNQWLTWHKKGQPLKYFEIKDNVHKNAEQRSIFAAKVMADRLDQSEDRVAAIVMGGAHVGTIQRELVKRGYSVVTIVTRSVGLNDYVKNRLLEREQWRRLNASKPHLR